MKIIDNRKDIYDYLVGIYGIDEKIILDRRNYKNYDSESTFGYGKKYTLINRDTFYFYLNDTRIKCQLLYKYNNKLYNKYELAALKDKYLTSSPHYNSSLELWIIKLVKDNKVSIYTKELSKEKVCKVKYPICIDDNYHRGELIPIILRNSPLLQLYTVEEFYTEIYNYFLFPDNKEIDNRTNIQKIEAHGFDKITSFRNM